MKAFLITILILISSFIGLYAQPKHSFYLNTGYTYNSPIELNEESVKNSQGFLFTIGGVKKLFSYKENYFELGVAAKTVFATGEIGGEKFNASTVRLAIPAKLVFPIAEKWEISTGIILQNNMDFNRLDLRLRNKYDWRFDVFGETKYWVNQDWFLSASANFNIKNIPDPFFINDPKVAFVVGVGKRVLIVRKKKEARKARRKLKRKNK